MTPDLAELKRIAEAASPGPWRGDRIDGSVKYDLLDANGQSVIHGDDGNVSHAHCYGIQFDKDEAYLLAFDPPTCLALIAENDAQAARIEALEAGLKPFADLADKFPGVMVEVCEPHYGNPSRHIRALNANCFRIAANLIDAARAEGPAPPGGGGALVQAALHDADEISGRIQRGNRANLSDVERLRNHVRRLAAALTKGADRG
jgi:hypothetical protein